MTYGPPIPYMECGNLITVNDLWSPHTLYGMWEPDSYGLPHVWSDDPPLPYVEQVSYGPPHMYDMIFFSGDLRKRSTVCPN